MQFRKMGMSILIVWQVNDPLCICRSTGHFCDGEFKTIGNIDSNPVSFTGHGVLNTHISGLIDSAINPYNILI